MFITVVIVVIHKVTGYLRHYHRSTTSRYTSTLKEGFLEGNEGGRQCLQC